ncbi:MAG: DeoR/GlpR family DNA-binding transcription regulator [Nakamurella sp.]
MNARGGAPASRVARQQQILDHVLGTGSATAAELAEMTGRSLMTVHRDLDDLAGRGMLRKFHGGVSALPTSVFESSSDFRRQRRTAAKDALARRALEFVEPGMSIMLDDSTTVLALARLLGDVGPLTVLTNYRQAIELLVDATDVRLIVVGGQYSRTHDSFIGPPDQTGLDTYAVDVVFQSTSTMDETMTYHQERDIVAMKRVMLQAGSRRVLMMDGSKVGQTSLHRYVALDQFTDVILTDDVDPVVVERMAERAVVHLVRL